MPYATFYCIWLTKIVNSVLYSCFSPAEKLQLNVILLQVYRFCAIGIWQNKYAFVFNISVLLLVMRYSKTCYVLKRLQMEGGGVVTLPLFWGNHLISIIKIFFRHVLMRNWGVQCVTAGSISQLVWHTCVSVCVLGRGGGIFFERNSSQWSQWYFYDFKEMPVWGWSRNSLL